MELKWIEQSKDLSWRSRNTEHHFVIVRTDDIYNLQAPWELTSDENIKCNSLEDAKDLAEVLVRDNKQED